MTELNPPFALQNAGATHTAAGDRMMLGGLFAGARTTGSLIPAGGVNMSLGGLFSASQTGSPSMAVLVGSGVCYVPGTEGGSQGLYGCVNDGTITETITAAHGTLPRIDSLVARVYDSQYSGVTDTWAIEVIAGTAAASPVAPTLPPNCLRLYNINVGAAVSSIVNANLVDVRPHATATGGIISTTSGNKPATNTVAPGQAIWLRDTKDLQFNDNGTWVTKSSSNTTQSGSNNVTFTSKSSHTYAVTFPVAFASTPKVFSNINNAAGVTAGWGSRCYNISTTGFTMFVFSDDGVSVNWSGIEVQWFASL